MKDEKHRKAKADIYNDSTWQMTHKTVELPRIQSNLIGTNGNELHDQKTAFVYFCCCLLRICLNSQVALQLNTAQCIL